MALEIGQQVKLIQPVIQGEIKDTEYDKDAKQLRHLLEWTTADGETHSRWFIESELEIVNV